MGFFFFWFFDLGFVAGGGGFRYGVGLLWWLAELWHGRVRIKAQREDSNGEERERVTQRREQRRGNRESQREESETNGV